MLLPRSALPPHGGGIEGGHLILGVRFARLEQPVMAAWDSSFWTHNIDGYRSPRILLVDDDPEMIELVTHILEDNDFDVVPQFSGEEAWQALLDFQDQPEDEVDLVLLDVMMTGMDGYELCERIKQHDQLRFTPVLMMTALSSVDDKTLGLGVGADDYITKPFDPRELLARIGAMLRIRRMEQELRQRNRELATLNALNQSVASSLDLHQILANAMQGVSELANVEAGFLVLIDPKSAERVVSQHFARKPRFDLAARVAHYEIVENVIECGQPLLINDVPGDPRFSRQPDLAVSSVLCVPLVVKDEVVGAIQVVNKLNGPFDENDHALFLSIAASVAAAIENSWLYSELADFAQELERSQAQLVQAEKMAAVGRLAASIAHEINNPLQAIHNSLHLTLRPTLSEEKKARYLAMAQEEVERLIDIVRRLLEFYRPSRGRRVLADVNQVIDNVLALTNKRLQHGHVTVQTRLALDLPMLRIVPDQLAQVFLNIVINAVEAMPEGGQLTVCTAKTQDDRWVRITFADDGPGMDERTRASIFEPFFTTKHTGTGLGLAISYGIIERHGGLIQVDSTPGIGSAFAVQLPIVNATQS
jgi:signal transduction histidine kinase/DNA-binding response OmpR family regulator